VANTTTGLFQELVLPATAALQSPLMLANTMLRRVYVQAQPIPGSVGKTIDVNIPTVSRNDVVDIGSGPISITDQTHTNVQLVVNQNKSKALIIREFDQVRSPLQMRDFYLMPAIESVTQAINLSICNLVNTTNFNVHSSITAGADVFTRAQVAQAWANLRGIGVPDDPANQFFITSHVPYSNMIGDDANKWITESIVGVSAAEAAQQRARLAPAFNAQIDYDQLFPQPTAGSTYAGLFFHRHAIALVPVVPAMGGKSHVEETTYQPEGSGLTYRVQFWYDPREQGYVLHVHCIYALNVVRPNFGSYLVTT
jgi:hypothetical protein